MLRIIMALVLALTSLGLSALPVMAAGTWSSKTPMPAARSHAMAAVIDGILYVAGGHDGAGGTTTLQAYNPATNTWSTLANMPGRRYWADGGAVINGELYVAGGWNYPDSTLPQNTLFVYNPGTNSWRSETSMPTLSAGGASGVIYGKFYVTTPENGYSGWTNFLHVYDPATHTWSQLASSPNVHDGPAYGVINDKLYVAGGSDVNGNPSDKLDVYDPATNTWTAKAPLPTVGTRLASAVMNGKLYAIGGLTPPNTSLASVYVYDPSTDAWTTETPMPTARHVAVAGAIDGVIYVAGGVNSTGTLATVEALTFATTSLTITASAGANGAITPAGAVMVNQGASQSFTITPNTGYHIADVLVDGSSVGAVASYTFTNVTANHTIAASFLVTNQPPFALFSYSPAEPQVNQKVTFNASISYDPDGTIVSYQWNFGDGGTGSGVVVEHTYATANQYSVILTVTDNNGATDAEAKTITITQPPPSPPAGRRSLPDPSTWAMVSSGLVVALFYLGLSRLRRRLSRS